MPPLIVVFALSIFGMLVLLVRHLPEAVEMPDDELDVRVSEESTTGVFVRLCINRVDGWYNTRAKNTFLHLVDRMLKVFERRAGQVAGKTKIVRVMVQERFKIIPRESLYWREIRTWKRKNGNNSNNEEMFHGEGEDISNHDDAIFIG